MNSKKIMLSMAVAFGLGVGFVSSADAASVWALRKVDSRAPGGFRELSRHRDSRACNQARKRHQAADPRGSYGCMKVPS